MSEENSGEKTFEPTPKRKSDAARKGDVLRSRELGTAAGLATGIAVLTLVGGWLFDSMKNVAANGFIFDRRAIEDMQPGNLFSDISAEVMPPVIVIGLAVAIMTTASQLLLGEGRFVPSSLKPKGSRINPLSGLKRIFGTQGLIELGKSLLKLVLLGGIAWWWATGNISDLFGLGRVPLEAQLAFAWDAGLSLVGLLVIGLVVIAMVDYPAQLFQRNKRLKMSHKDMREEIKQSEGSPEVKMARRQRQRDLARGGVARAMKDAQFVIVNPMHFAVALTYDPDIAPAPVLLAKGRGETALAMRDIAGENDLPILHYPRLARAVYFTTRQNQMVREELYVAIASLVAFVLSLKRGDSVRKPVISVPDALHFDADGRAISKGKDP